MQLPPPSPAWLQALSQVPAAPVMPALDLSQAAALDLSPGNEALYRIDLADTAVFSDYLFGTLLPDGTPGAGGYLERREIYRRSRLFDTEAAGRNIHLGIDIWTPRLLPVHALLPGTVAALANNEGFGNYGGTVLLRHEVAGEAFFALYGHLGLEGLRHLRVGQQVEAGQEVGALGAPHENGDWPPHLHFQLIRRWEGPEGDFPGVCAQPEQAYYQACCPNPNLLLRIPALA